MPKVAGKGKPSHFPLDTLPRAEYTFFIVEPMADEDQKLCDSCHERPGTNNICYGGGKSLCVICLRQDFEVGALMQRIDETIRVGHCKYCGAPAETSFGGSFSPVTGARFNLVCMACFTDLTDFAQRPENANPDFDFEDKTAREKILTHYADLEKRQDEFMREQVLKRKSK